MNRRGPDDCWEWTGGKNRRFRYKGKFALVHRVAYELQKEVELPAGVHIRHRCGNVLCCNGEHLYAPGWAPPMSNGRTVFSKEEKALIREEREAGVPLTEIRKKWGADTRTLLLLG